MIAHVVLFEPKPDLSERDRVALIEGLRALTRDVPVVRRLRVGRRIRHGLPGYEQMMRDDYSFAVILEFDSIDDLRSYLRHPAHQNVGHYFISLSARALAYDYELADDVDAAELLQE